MDHPHQSGGNTSLELLLRCPELPRPSLSPVNGDNDDAVGDVEGSHSSDTAWGQQSELGRGTRGGNGDRRWPEVPVPHSGAMEHPGVCASLCPTHQSQG